MGTEPDFRILGPLDVAVDGAARPDLGGPQQRRLLAMLLLHLNRIVPADRIVDGLWASRPPAGADVTLRTHVSHLRRRLAAVGAAGSLVTRPPGYGLFLEPERVDAHRFEGLLGHGQEALGLAQPAQAADLLRRALNQWRGPVLAGLDAPAFAESETARLEELRLVALESRIDADLALGRHHDVIAELERLVAAHPFREGFLGQLMLALYRSGRQVDALAVYSSARDHLADELGLDPGPVLADLETAILRHDPALLPSPAWTAEPGVVRPARVRPPPDALFTLARRVRMVGRSAEWHRLRALWRRVSERDRGVVLISGEAGVGKTRLVAELTHLVAGEGTTLLVARCAQAGSPYHPIASALRGSAEVDDALANAPDAIRARLAPVLDGPPRPAGEELTERDDPAGQPLPLFEAVVWLIRRIADATPVVVVVEDAERIDRSSSLLLRHLVDGLPERVLIVVCFRDPPGSRHAPLLELLGDVGGRGLTERMALRPLTEEGLGTLVTDLVGAAPPDVVRRLWSRTGGNPFFATEMVRDLEGRGELTSGGRWQVPPGVRDVLRHRLRTLAESTRHVVRCAAVLGSEIRFDLLTRITDQGEDLLVESLDDAVAAGFLVESGRSWQVSYAFPHDLMRDAVYADIPVPRRQRLHLRAAQALHGGGPGRRADVITAAVHLRAAGSAADPVQAAQLSLRAADEARRLYAWDEAVAHAEAAVDLLRHADAPAAQQADAAVCAAMFRLKASIGYGRAIEHLEYALERYRTIGDDAALGS
ncbi:MAG TPA: BTAD domain-containing putative transcriptional regulator, partial [Actinoplanes sp.]|nr:BTAD domain-containing putative transcriptional regulator [Actinoplanes sp.]